MVKPSNWHKEDGFEFALFPAKSGKAKNLVLVLHGHGSNTANWAEHAKQMHDEMPDADILTLQGPIRMPKGPDGVQNYTWTAYEGPILKQAAQSLKLVFNHLPVVDKLNSFIDKQLAKRGLTPDELGLVGSSMGGIVVLQTALSRRKAVGGVVSHSGALLPFTKVKSKPDILLIMGGKDEIFSKPEVKAKGLKRAFAEVKKRLSIQHKDTLKRFRRRGVQITEIFYPGMGHEVTPESIKAGDEFLLKALEKKKKPKV
jgi:phospholipase/carboxylesterase